MARSPFHDGTQWYHRITVGGWRTIDAGLMQIFSGPIGKEKVHFEALSADRLEGEMQAFLAWFGNEDGIDPVIKAGIAHLWFASIHPFEDENGRSTSYRLPDREEICLTLTMDKGPLF